MARRTRASRHVWRPGTGVLRRGLRRYWLLVLLLALVCGAVGLQASRWVPTTYTSSTRVLISPLQGNPLAPGRRADDLVSMETESQIVRSDPVITRAEEILGRNLAPAQVARALSVTVPDRTTVLRIAYRGRVAPRTAEVVDAITTAYLEQRQERGKEVLTTRIARLDEEIAAGQKSLAALTRATKEGSAASREESQRRAEALTRQVFELRRDQTDAEQATTEPGRALVPVTTSATRSPTMATALASAGLVGGATLGLVLALWWQLRRERRARHGAALHALPTAAGAAERAAVPRPVDAVGAGRRPAGR